METRTDYYSFLLRLWKTDDADAVIWRASLERPGTREHRGFASLEALFAYLREQTAPAGDSPLTEQHLAGR